MCTIDKKKETRQEGQFVQGHDQKYPGEQVSDTRTPTKKQVQAAVKKVNPDAHSMGSRG